MSAPLSPQKTWSIIELVQWASNHLREKGFDDARLNVELILAFVLGFRRIELYTKFDRPLSQIELDRFKALFRRRLAHEPVQYILGTAQFMGFDFHVESGVLIPRPETEAVVEKAMGFCKSLASTGTSLRILDIGSGSGCIGISLSLLLKDIHVTAIDPDPIAVHTIRTNASLLGAHDRITIMQVSLQDFIHGINAEPFDVVVANPPYISTTEYELLAPEIRDFEPKSALTDGGDGLSFYRILSHDMKPCIKDHGAMILEHAYNQAHDVEEIFLSEGWIAKESFMDYSKNPRGIILIRGERT